MDRREELLARVQERLEKAATDQDLSGILDPAALEEGNELAQFLRDEDDLEVRYFLGWLYWYTYQAGSGKERQDLVFVVRLFTPCFINEAGNLPEPLLPILAESSFATVAALVREINGLSELTLISATVSLCERIIGVIGVDHPYRTSMLSNLGNALLTRFEASGEINDLDRGIHSFETALAATSPNDPERNMDLSNLGTALVNRYERTGDVADISAALGMLETVLIATRIDDEKRPMRLYNLGLAFHARFKRGRMAADLDKALEAFEVASAKTPTGHPRRG